MPVVLMTLPIMSTALRTVIRIVPPLASIVPLFLTLFEKLLTVSPAVVAAVGSATRNDTSPLPAKSIVKSRPPPKAIFPNVALINAPLLRFSTFLPASTAYPDGTLIWPSLVMAASVASENTKLPLVLLKKLTSVMLAVVARNPAALTLPVEPMTVPLGLRIQTWPCAVIVPSILKGVVPLLRLSVIDWLPLNWSKFKVSPSFNSMTDQTSTARRSFCVTVNVLVASSLWNVTTGVTAGVPDPGIGATVNGIVGAGTPSLAAASAGMPTAKASVVRNDSRRIARRRVRP